MTDVSLPSAAISVHASAAPAAAASTCVTCGHAGALAFCPHCGQPARRGRLTVRGVFAHLVADALDLDRGLGFTAVELSRRPGHAIREYLAGKTVRYSNPVKYFLVAAAISTFIYIQTGMAARSGAELASGMAEGSQGALALQPAQVAEFIGTWFNLLMAAALPVSALFSHLLFRRAGYNYAEHLVFNTFVYAQQALLFVIVALVFTTTDPLGMTVMLVASLAYYAWAAAGAFRVGAVSATLRSVAVNLLAYLVYFFAVMAAGIVVGVAVILSTR